MPRSTFRRRGRPRAAIIPDGRDGGTPELQAKRAAKLTSEPLDLLLARGHITEQQHWCALHLRWLYSLRYGVPAARISERLKDEPAGNAAPLSDARRGKLEGEYQHATRVLERYGALDAVLRVAVYGSPPADSHRLPLRDGLQLLERLWCRAARRRGCASSRGAVISANSISPCFT